MPYERVQLRHVANIRGGKRLSVGEVFATEQTVHPYIRARDIGEGRIHIHDPVYLDERVARRLSRYTVQEGDVCVTIVGANVGEMGAVPKSLAGANLTENAVKIVANEKVNQVYLKYALLSPDALAQMKVLAGGAAQPKLGIYKIETVEIPVPPIATQFQIASILSSYDTMIEVNARRIAILEEMARRVFDEWFTRFQFPGADVSPKRKVQPPENWQVKPFSYAVDVMSGGTPRKADPAFWNGTIAFFTPTDAGQRIFALETTDNITELGLSKCASRLYEPWSVFITARGTVGRVLFAGAPMAMNQSCYALQGKGGYPQIFVYELAVRAASAFRQMAHGAVFDTIVKDTFDKYEVCLPPVSLAQAYDQLVRPMYEAVLVHTKEVAVLRTARDFLLPKLICGEIDLEQAGRGNDRTAARVAAA